MKNLLNTSDPPRSRVIAGTVVVAFVLALSRWGTNLGFNPMFISDVLISFAVIHVLSSRNMKGERRKRPGFAGVTALFATLMTYVGLRGVLAFGQEAIVVWLRDLVPYLYGLLAVLSAYSISRSSTAARNTTMRVFRWALAIHVLWVAAVSFTGNAGGFPVLGAVASAPVFEVRPDIDVALIAIACALNLRQVIVGRRIFWNLVGLALGVTVVFLHTATRAGQLSLLLALAASFAFTFAASRHATGRRLLLVFALPAVAAALLIVLPTTAAGERLVATVLPSISEDTAGQVNAEGTQRAREQVWSGVINWTSEIPARAALGSGFGNDFLAESGTKEFLEGTTYTGVRSPHNWFVGTYARLGAVGIALAVAWLIQLLAIMWRRRQLVGEDDLIAFSAATILAILPVATFGVVLEAPFGAIPFFWAAGIIMASRRIPVSNAPSGRERRARRGIGGKHRRGSALSQLDGSDRIDAPT